MSENVYMFPKLEIHYSKEETVVIARYGKPIVKMTIYQDIPLSGRIGIAKGKLKTPENLDCDNAEIASLIQENIRSL